MAEITTTKKTVTTRKAAAKPAAAPATAAADKVEAAAAKLTEPAGNGRSFNLGTIDLSQVDVRALATDAAYATVGAVDAVVEEARELPKKAVAVRKDAETFVKAAPSKVEAQVSEALDTAKEQFKGYAQRGRKVVDTISNATATKKALDQTETARAQVKGAVTSLRKVVETSQDAVETAVGRIGLRRSA